jgi:hypothetical protein
MFSWFAGWLSFAAARLIPSSTSLSSRWENPKVCRDHNL